MEATNGFEGWRVTSIQDKRPTLVLHPHDNLWGEDPTLYPCHLKTLVFPNVWLRTFHQIFNLIITSISYISMRRGLARVERLVRVLGVLAFVG